MRALSVVIPNHNYGEFVGAAVTSALDVDWPSVEVVVVDDGSTDDSRAILRGFGDRITLIEQDNAGPRVACNRGFAASSGDAVIFLDSDDVLDPGIARAAAEVWHPGVSKVQVQMRRIDGTGAPHGRHFPNYRFTPTPEQIRTWMSETSAYPTPPGSGNVYAREFLDRIMPLDDVCGDATDSACLAAAPYLGDVVTVPLPLVGYRVHGRNRSALSPDPGRFTRQIERAQQRHRFARQVSGRQADPVAAVRELRRGRHLLQMRVAASRVSPGGSSIPSDNRRRMAWDSLVNLGAPGWESATHRLVVAAWCLATLAAPGPLARRLVSRRFS
ncbi:glycosyltransferase family 2 protein [Pseudonocardia alni]|uniref:glycosyltransferase family 2 protein n=1 Tax=Pseudonocardia alni TaxID=33907 RepID=UPI0027A6CA0E|nr:glycosyltransferase family 2 protein [Pseudonocardia alni]